MKYILVAIFVLVNGINVLAYSYSGGSGTVNDPYKLSTLEDLRYLSEHSDDWNKCYILTNNIDANDTKSWNDGSGFNPIGKYAEVYFEGVFDGMGYEISNLSIDRLSENFVGFFGALSSTAEVKNLGLVDCSIYGNRNVGGLVAYSVSKNISNCFVNGSVAGINNVGGVISVAVWSKATISNSYFSGYVTLMGGTNAGGFIYSNKAEILNCYSSAIIDTIRYISGFCKDNEGTIQGSFWNNDLAKGKKYSGCIGITTSQMANQKMLENMGWDFKNIWTINNSVPVLRIMKSTLIKKISFKGSGTETDPYQIEDINQLQEISIDLDANYILVNDIDGSETKNWNGGYGFLPIGNTINGFKGKVDGKGFTINNIYIDLSSNGDNSFLGFVTLFEKIDSTGIIRNLIIDSLQFIANENKFSGLCIYNFGTIENCILNNIVISDKYPASTGAGLCHDNYGNIINSSTNITANQHSIGGLCNMNYGNIDSCYSETFVIEGSQSSGFCQYNEGIISNSSSTADIEHLPYKGSVSAVFCGDNRGSILHCSAFGNISGYDIVGGLVGKNHGLIRNCIADCEVVCTEEVGGVLCGEGTNNSEIKYCFSKGRIDGKTFIGGFIGYNYGIVKECYSNVETIGNNVSGGFVGYNNDTIINCYSTGDVYSSTKYAGGFCGANHWVIKNCYASSQIDSESANGGFVYWDHDEFLSIINCFYNRTQSGKTCKFASGLTEEQMKRELQFRSCEWDFDNIWCIEEDKTYPKLQVFGDCHPTSIPENEAFTDDCVIYPNPSQGEIHFANYDGIISIINSLGMEVWRGFVKDNTVIDVSAFGSGMYIVRMKDMIVKFIKE